MLISRRTLPHELLILDHDILTLRMIGTMQPLYHQDNDGKVRSVRIAHNFHIMNRIELQSTPIEIFMFGSGTFNRNEQLIAIFKGYNHTYILIGTMSRSNILRLAYNPNEIKIYSEYKCPECKEKCSTIGYECKFCGNSTIESKINKYSRFIIKPVKLKDFIAPMLYSYIYQMQEMAGLDERMGVKL